MKRYVEEIRGFIGILIAVSVCVVVIAHQLGTSEKETKSTSGALDIKQLVYTLNSKVLTRGAFAKTAKVKGCFIIDARIPKPSQHLDPIPEATSLSERDVRNLNFPSEFSSNVEAARLVIICGDPPQADFIERFSKMLAVYDKPVYMYYLNTAAR